MNKYSKTQIKEAISYWTDMLQKINESSIHYRHQNTFDEEVYKGITPFTKDECDWIIKNLGETKDFREAGWILPDGRMPNMHRTQTAINDELPPDRVDHDFLPVPKDRADEMRNFRKKYRIFPREYFEAAGLVRIDAGTSGAVSCIKHPTPQQMDKLYDFVDLPWEDMQNIVTKKKGITDFSADFQIETIIFDDVDDFRKSLMNKIKLYT